MIDPFDGNGAPNDMLIVWSSGMTPLPIAERRNGICVRSIKKRTSSSASDDADIHPFRRVLRDAPVCLRGPDPLSTRTIRWSG
jgi:hypothetical protein